MNLFHCEHLNIYFPWLVFQPAVYIFLFSSIFHSLSCHSFFQTSQAQLMTNVLPLIVRAYDDNDARIQEEGLRKSVSLAKQLDTQVRAPYLVFMIAFQFIPSNPLPFHEGGIVSLQMHQRSDARCTHTLFAVSLSFLYSFIFLEAFFN